MKCLDIKIWLQNWLDGQAPGADGQRTVEPAAQAHFRQCKACREQFAAAQRMVEGMKLFSRPTSPARDLSRSIVAKALQDRVERRLKFQRRLRLTVALAASILIMVIAGYIFEPGPKKDNGNGVVAKQEAPATDPRKQEAPPEKSKEDSTPALAKALDEAKGTMAALTGKLTDQTRESAKRLITAATPTLELPPMGTGILPEESIDATASVLKAGQEISDGIQPVTRSARRAMDFFLREMSTFEVAKVE